MLRRSKVYVSHGIYLGFECIVSSVAGLAVCYKTHGIPQGDSKTKSRLHSIAATARQSSRALRGWHLNVCNIVIYFLMVEKCSNLAYLQFFVRTANGKVQYAELVVPANWLLSICCPLRRFPMLLKQGNTSDMIW